MQPYRLPGISGPPPTGLVASDEGSAPPPTRKLEHVSRAGGPARRPPTTRKLIQDRDLTQVEALPPPPGGFKSEPPPVGGAANSVSPAKSAAPKGPLAKVQRHSMLERSASAPANALSAATPAGSPPAPRPNVGLSGSSPPLAKKLVRISITGAAIQQVTVTAGSTVGEAIATIGKKLGAFDGSNYGLFEVVPNREPQELADMNTTLGDYLMSWPGENPPGYKFSFEPRPPPPTLVGQPTPTSPPPVPREPGNIYGSMPGPSIYGTMPQNAPPAGLSASSDADDSLSDPPSDVRLDDVPSMRSSLDVETNHRKLSRGGGGSWSAGRLSSDGAMFGATRSPSRSPSVSLSSGSLRAFKPGAFCDRCGEGTLATVGCQKCTVPLCADCDVELHRKGTWTLHLRIPLVPDVPDKGQEPQPPTPDAVSTLAPGPASMRTSGPLPSSLPLPAAVAVSAPAPSKPPPAPPGSRQPQPPVQPVVSDAPAQSSPPTKPPPAAPAGLPAPSSAARPASDTGPAKPLPVPSAGVPSFPAGPSPPGALPGPPPAEVQSPPIAPVATTGLPSRMPSVPPPPRLPTGPAAVVASPPPAKPPPPVPPSTAPSAAANGVSSKVMPAVAPPKMLGSTLPGLPKPRAFPPPDSVLQEKAYRRWANFCLAPRGVVVSSLLDGSLADGTVLVALVESLIGQSLFGYHPAPTTPAERLQNVTVALDAVRSLGIAVSSSAEDFQRGDKQSILSFFWQLICNSANGTLQPSDESETKRHVLSWCHRLVHASAGISVHSPADLRNGLAYCALLAALWPGYIDMAVLQRQEPALAMSSFLAACESLSIPCIFDVQDFAQTPDERSLLTLLFVIYYVAMSSGLSV